MYKLVNVLYNDYYICSYIEFFSNPDKLDFTLVKNHMMTILGKFYQERIEDLTYKIDDLKDIK